MSHATPHSNNSGHSPFGPPTGPAHGGAQSGRRNASSGNRGRVVAVGLGAVVVLVVTIVAVKTIGGSDASKGGANTPESTVTSFINALHDEDPLALVDLLDPGEAGLVRGNVKTFEDIVSGKDTTSPVAKRYQKQGFGTVNLNDLVPGFTVDISNLKVETESLGATFAKVRLRSVDAKWTFNAGQFTKVVDLSSVHNGTQPSLHDSSGTIDQAKLESLYGANSPVDAPFLITSKVAGRWYVNIELTALETTRIIDKLKPANWGDIGATKNFGGDTPADALAQMVKGFAAGQTIDIIQTLPPKRYEPLYRFRESFTTFTTNATAKVDIKDNKLVRDKRGTLLPLDGSTISITRTDPHFGDRDTVSVQFAKDCFTYSEQKYDAYYNQTTTSNNNKCWSDLAELAKNVPTGTFDLSWLKTVADIDGFWVNVEQVDGRWFVDPVETVAAYTHIISAAANG